MNKHKIMFYVRGRKYFVNNVYNIISLLILYLLYIIFIYLYIYIEYIYVYIYIHINIHIYVIYILDNMNSLLLII